MLKRGTLLLLWGLTLLWSFHSGRLDLLLRGVFHGLVGVTNAGLRDQLWIGDQHRDDLFALEQPQRPFLAQTVLELTCLLYTSPSPRDRTRSRMPSSA